MADETEGAHAGRCVGFAGTSRIAEGALPEVAAAAWRARDRDPGAAVLMFDGETGKVIDLDLRGTELDVAQRLTPPVAATRGRPKLGVVAREVTLLPRHWDWLARQSGGASVALRRLVEIARKADAGPDDTRARTAAAYRFMATMAGDLPGFEEATRALFAGDRGGLERRMSGWPPGIRDEVLRFVAGAA